MIEEAMSYWTVAGIVVVLLAGVVLYARRVWRSKKKSEDASNIYPLW